MGRVTGKVAMITGAGQGLGQAMARLLAREGAHVVASDINFDAAQRCADDIKEAGGQAMALRLDVASADEWGRAMQAVRDGPGRLDVLVNNAGIVIAGNIETTTPENWRQTMAINLDGVFYGCQHSVAMMKETGGGSIINISSIDGLIGEADLVSYGAAKAGVCNLSKTVAVHCGEQGYGIRCNSVHPGYIWTEHTENYLRDLGSLEETKASALARHPIGFLGEPDDVAYMVLYLASDESRFVTGAEMVVDGGYLAV